MPDPTPDAEMTLADALKITRRRVPVLDKSGKPTGRYKEAKIPEADVLSWREYPTHVHVVTVDGQRFRGDK